MALNQMVSVNYFMMAIIYYLSVSKNGAKSFYFRGYRFNGKLINEFSLSTYRVNDKDNTGDLTLSEARDIIRTYRQGINYHQQQKADKIRAEIEQTNTLDDCFNRWIETKSDKAPSAITRDVMPNG